MLGELRGDKTTSGQMAKRKLRHGGHVAGASQIDRLSRPDMNTVK